MKKTEILCPDCFKGILITPEDDTDNYAVCPKCKSDFTITAPNTVVYGGTQKSSTEPSKEPITKKFQVTIVVGEDKQWTFGYGATAEEAMENVMKTVFALRAVEVDDDEC